MDPGLSRERRGRGRTHKPEITEGGTEGMLVRSSRMQLENVLHL